MLCVQAVLFHKYSDSVDKVPFLIKRDWNEHEVNLNFTIPRRRASIN